MSGKGSLRCPPTVGQLSFPESSLPQLSVPHPHPHPTPHSHPQSLKDSPPPHSPEQYPGLTYRLIAALFIFAPMGSTRALLQQAMDKCTVVHPSRE